MADEAKCLAVLRSALATKGDADFWPAMHAAEGLTAAGYGREVLDVLPARLKTETDDRKRCGLARELVRAGDLSYLPILLEVLGKENSYGHVHAAESLFKIGEINDGLLLRRRLDSAKDPALRVMAAAALGKAGSPRAMKLLRELAKSENPEVHGLASWVLGMIGDAGDAPQLRANIERSQEPLPRSFAQHALALVGDPTGRKSLIENLTAPELDVQSGAANFAGEAGMTAAAATLGRLLDDPKLDVRVRSAHSLLLLSKANPPPRDEIIVRAVFPATAQNPRFSEGSIVRRRDGSLLFAITDFSGSTSDFANAGITAKESRDGGRTWSEPRLLQKNIGKLNTMSATLRYLSHPVGKDTPIGLFFLNTNSMSDLPVLLRISHDSGKTFGGLIKVTTQPGYHVMNNDRVTLLRSGRLLCPIAWTDDVEKTNHFVSYCCFSDDGGKTWRHGKGKVDLPGRGALEPETIELNDGRVLMIMRTTLGHVAGAHSKDGGDTWDKPFALPLKAPDAPATIRRIPATGDLLLVWNNNHDAKADHAGRRNPLTAAVSDDEGRTWKHVRDIETNPKEDYAYTSLIFVRDRAVLSYYVEDKTTGRISTRFRSVPVRWFYGAK